LIVKLLSGLTDAPKAADGGVRSGIEPASGSSKSEQEDKENVIATAKLINTLVLISFFMFII
jgi:hypothetical protein